MKKGVMYEGYVKQVNFPNKAIVEVEETDADGNVVKERVQVKGALPGQKIRFSISKLRKGKSQGKLKEVLEKGSVEDVVAECPHFGTCGGCQYQTMSYENQLELKKTQVLRLIDEVYKEGEDGNRYQYDGILPSPSPWAYRNKMEFSFGDEYKGGPLTLGLHKKGSFYDIVDAEGCKLVHPDFSQILACVRNFGRENQLSYYHKGSHTGLFRHLLLRRSYETGELLIALVTSSQVAFDVEGLGERLKELPLSGTIAGFLHIINDGLGDVVKSDETRIVFGKDWFSEKILGLSFKITPFSFFQTNTKGAEVLYERAREYILAESSSEEKNDVSANTDSDKLKGKVVFDLYSGTGTIAQVIAPVAGKVIGVEIVEEAVVAARENAQRNGLDNCEFIAGDVLKVLDDIEEKPDFIILDPPRDGIHPKALTKIIEYGVPQIVYISCKPTSLARDLVTFQECGYELKRVSNVDMFSQTPHVESVCLLSKVHN